MATVSLAHDGNGTASVNTNASSSTTFTLTSLNVSDMTVNLVVSVCSGALAPGSCTRSPTSVFLPSLASRTITVNFTGGAAAGTGTITLRANNTSGTQLAASSVTVTVNAPIAGPSVTASAHRGDAIDVSQCIADCFETSFSYTTPAYISLDVPRTATLLYRSGRAKPYGRLRLDVKDPSFLVTRFLLQLRDPNGSNVTFSNGSTSLFFAAQAAVDTTHLAAEFDAATVPTSARQYTAYVTSFKTDGTQLGTTSLPVRIIVINDQTSPFGAGVEIVGLQRIFTNQAGGVLVTDGGGSASFFAGGCSPSVACTFTSPGGDFSVLTTGGNHYARTYPDGSVVTFDNVGKELSAKSRFGDSTSVTWATNAAGVVVPTGFTDPVGQTIGLNYNGVMPPYQTGSFGQFAVPGGRLANFGVLTSGNLENLGDVDGQSYGVAGYDTQHRLTSFVNKKGGTSSYSYAYGRTPASIDAPSVAISTGASVQPRTQLREAYAGLYSAAASGGGTSLANLLPVPTSDIRAALTDPLGNSTFFSINRFGSSQKTYAPIIAADSSEYDSVTGQLKRYVSPQGGVTKFTWSADKLTQTYDSTAGKTVNITYETGTSISLPNHIYGDIADQSFTYDHTKPGLPLKTSTVSGAAAASYLFDVYGRPTSVTDPAGHTTSYGYGVTGLKNRISVTAPNGQTTSFAKDAIGRDTMVTDAYGRKAKTQYDVLNRRTLFADAAADTTRLQYDLLDALTVVTDPKAQVYTTARNALGWPVTQTDPGSRVDTTKYDAGGHVVYVRTRALRQLTFAYDALGRLTKQLGQTSGDSVKYAYDAQSRWVIDSVYHGSTLVSVDSIVTDSVGRTIREYTNRPGVGSWQVVSSFNPTDPGRSSVGLTKISPLTTVAQVNYSYDASKRLSGISIPIAPNGNSTFGYNAENFPSTVTFQNGQPVETTTQTPDHAESMRSYSISAIDTVLRRWYRTDSLSRIVQRGGKDSLFQNFTYDSAGRLRTWVRRGRTNTPNCTNNSNPPSYGYTCNGVTSILVDSTAATYDRVGNPTGTGTSVVAGNRLLTFNGYTMTYDNDGNMLTRVGPGGVNDTYTWDDFGQLKSVTRSGVPPTTFAYDGFGRRIRKTSTVGGITQTIHYIWDGGQIFAEVDASGTTLQTYSYNPEVDEPRTVTAGGQVYYMSTGYGGDVNGLIKQSDNSVAALYKYNPWGELETDQQLIGTARVNSLRWRGLAYDSESGLYQVRARYYDPATRRFISEDPIGLDGGINQYAFAGADPVNRRDPSGLCWVWNASYRTGHPEEAVSNWHWSNDCPLDPGVPGMGGIYDSPWGDPTTLRQLIDPWAVAKTIEKIQNAIKKAGGLEGSNTMAITGTFIGAVASPFGFAIPWAYVPSTRTICGGLGLGISMGRSVSAGVVNVHAAPGNAATDVLGEWSVSGGGNATVWKGWQGAINSSGYTIGNSIGSPGASGAITYSWCHSFGGG